MARKTYRYSLNRRDAKLLGVCSKLGDRFGIDPTFLRIGAVAFALMVEFQIAVIAYVALGIYFAVKQKQQARRDDRSDFERMDFATSIRPSVHAMRTELDPIDRRLMAIENEISKPNEELAREIEALREEK
ncbi:MAG TPA: PspC domain-containing protein [Sphingomicrobium sp.]|nr:PspC domain-containing protein [Sphingomicrobium sp.]